MVRALGRGAGPRDRPHHETTTNIANSEVLMHLAASEPPRNRQLVSGLEPSAARPPRGLAALEPDAPALPRPRVLFTVGLGLELERRNRRGAARDRVEGDEGHVRRAGVPALAGEQVLGL